MNFSSINFPNFQIHFFPFFNFKFFPNFQFQLFFISLFSFFKLKIFSTFLTFSFWIFQIWLIFYQFSKSFRNSFFSNYVQNSPTKIVLIRFLSTLFRILKIILNFLFNLYIQFFYFVTFFHIFDLFFYFEVFLQNYQIKNFIIFQL